MAVLRPRISVIVTTGNRATVPAQVVAALDAGSTAMRDVEVIIVADGRSDDTMAVVDRTASQFPLQRIMQSTAPGVAAARNLGASGATGNVLLFIDGDIEPAPGMVGVHVRAHEETPDAVVIGPLVPVRPRSADWQGIAEYESLQARLRAMGEPGHRFTFDEILAGVFSVQADRLRRLGGFDENFACREDRELACRLVDSAVAIRFEPAGGGTRHESRDAARLIRHKRAEGAADVRLARLHPSLFPVLPIGRAARGEHARPHPDRDAASVDASADRNALPLALAFRGRAGRIAAGLLRMARYTLRRLHMRGSWRRVHRTLLDYWYWRGVADEVHDSNGLDALAAWCAERDRFEPHEVHIDLRAGVDAAVRALDAKPVDAAVVTYGGAEIGRIAGRPGASRLLGAHLRHALETTMRGDYLAARQLDADGAGADGNSPAHHEPFVSIIVPAYEAAATLADTLDSLGRQEFMAWEAIVVDDGSMDATHTIAASHAQRDSRIHVVRQDHSGVSAARNTGLLATSAPWILFLDADDTIDPAMLLTMVAALRADPSLDAVHCAWRRVDEGGRVIATESGPAGSDLFPVLIHACAFAIHSCVVRRRLIEDVGGFDESIGVAEDWLLWLRLARSGARFGSIPETLATYRTRTGTLSTSPQRFLDSALRIIEIAHDTDAAVSRPIARYREGSNTVLDLGARLAPVWWAGGLALGSGDDPLPLVDVPAGDPPCAIDPAGVIELLRAATIGCGREQRSITDVITARGDVLVAFLERLERRAEAPGLAEAARRIAERVALRKDPPLTTRRVGKTLGMALDVAKPIEDAPAPDGADRLIAFVCMGDEPVGTIELPFVAGRVRASVLRDAIAADYAWPILGGFFEATIYKDLEYVDDGAGWSAWRNRKRLLDGLPADAAARRAAVHDAIGWSALIDAIESPDRGAPGSLPRSRDRTVIEVSLPLPHSIDDRSGRFVLTAGGCHVHEMIAPLSDDAGQLRRDLIDAAGYEICRIVVREAIVGQPFDNRITLRDRLAGLARVDVGHVADRMRPHQAHGVEWLPGLARTLTPDAGVASVLCRDPRAEPGTAAWRHASLPHDTATFVEDLFPAGPLSVDPGPGDETDAIIARSPDVSMAPDRLSEPAHDATAQTGGENAKELGAASRPAALAFGRHHFEALFAAGADPWRYESPYEELKYRRTFDMLPHARFGRVLEIACAEGHFTERLASVSETLVVADISDVALQRAADRCARFDHIEYVRLDLTTDELAGDFDLIVCSEVLYYMGGIEALRGVARRVSGALAEGGHLVMAHAHLLADDPDAPGFDWPLEFGAKTISDVFAATPGLALVRELRTSLYRIPLFCKAAVADPPRIETVDLGPQPMTRISGRIRWSGGSAHDAMREATTDRLPVLMYHRIAQDVAPGREPYRVTPADFEEQLRYLRDAGFHTVHLDDWIRATLHRKPLPGRAIVLTFDDGFADFRDTAWPLLRKYGFGATVFLVTERVGQWNRWDGDRRDEPLLQLDDILALRDTGVEFGAHTATHPRLTSLSHSDVIRELAASRAAIRRWTGQPVTAIAYPFGDEDRVIHHLAGACGYRIGLTTAGTRASLWHPLLATPRIDGSGCIDLADFIARLNG